MRITKFTHACVRIESGPTSLVIDPGSFSERDSVEGATAVLITHSHPDHLSIENLRATSAAVFTTGSVAGQIESEAPDVAERVSVLGPGDEFDVGLPVTAVGEWHAVIHDEIPRVHNCGYVVAAEGKSIYHPGDSFTLHRGSVDLLLAPVCAPWSKTSEVIEFIKAVGAPRTGAIHDLVFSDFGLGLVDSLIKGRLEDREQDYVRVAPGEELSA